MFGETITTNDMSCTTTVPFTKRSCTKSITRNILGSISQHSMALSCDYSTGYQISCLLRVDNLTSKDTSNVTCRILEGSTSEATRTAKLLPGINTDTPYSQTCHPQCMVTNLNLYSNQQYKLSAADIATHTYMYIIALASYPGTRLIIALIN